MMMMMMEIKIESSEKSKWNIGVNDLKNEKFSTIYSQRINRDRKMGNSILFFFFFLGCMKRKENENTQIVYRGITSSFDRRMTGSIDKLTGT